VEFEILSTSLEIIVGPDLIVSDGTLIVPHFIRLSVLGPDIISIVAHSSASDGNQGEKKYEGRDPQREWIRPPPGGL